MPDRAFQPDWFSKPGDTLTTLMSQHDISHTELAEELKIDIRKIRGLIAGTVGIDDEIAGRLAKCVGGTPSFWIKRQSAYQTALDRLARDMPAEAAKAWLRKFPRQEMSDFGWVDSSRQPVDALKSYLAYFGVTSPRDWEKRYTTFLTDTAFRTSASFDSKIGALSAWLRQGEIIANSIATAKWNEELLRNSLPELRRLSKRNAPSKFVTELRAICAAAGVAVAFVRSPSGCRASGASRFISPEKAMIVLSFRYLSDDHFWFTFFHEVGHLVLHGTDSTFVDSDITAADAKETEANSFAAAVLIPLERLEELHSLPPRMASVVRFAVSLGIAPGIVVGQMQHLGLVGRNKLNFLKRRYDWSELALSVD